MDSCIVVIVFERLERTFGRQGSDLRVNHALSSVSLLFTPLSGRTAKKAGSMLDTAFNTIPWFEYDIEKPIWKSLCLRLLDV